MGMHGQVMNGVMGSSPVKNDTFRVYHFFSRGLSDAAITHSVEQILEARFSLIITIGLSCALVTKKVLEQKKVSIPHIFVGLVDPFAHGLGESPEDLVAHNMTGILYDAYETKKAAQFLCEAKPHMQSLLVLLEEISLSGSHLRPDWIAQELASIKEVCEPRGVKVQHYAAPTLAELYTYVEKHINTFDTLILPEGTTTFTIYESLSDLCSKYNKTLFSGLIEPVAHGVALGYGASYESLGEHAVEYAYKLLIEGIPLSKLPLFKDLKGRQAVVNVSIARKQDLDPQHIEAVCRAWDGIIFRSVG